MLLWLLLSLILALNRDVVHWHSCEVPGALKLSAYRG